MKHLQIIIQQYLDSLAPDDGQARAAQILDRYLHFLAESRQIAEDCSIFNNTYDFATLRESVIGFIIKEPSAPEKQAALDRLKRFWSFVRHRKGWRKSPLGELPESVPCTEIERHLAILCLIQESGKTLKELSEQLLYNEATIVGDLHHIRNVQDFGSLIEEYVLDDSPVKYKFSLHPYLLAFKLPQIGELLTSIHQAIQDAAPHSQLLSRLYHDLWQRLTLYGKEYILTLGLPAPASLTPPLLPNKP